MRGMQSPAELFSRWIQQYTQTAHRASKYISASRSDIIKCSSQPNNITASHRASFIHSQNPSYTHAVDREPRRFSANQKLIEIFLL